MLFILHLFTCYILHTHLVYGAEDAIEAKVVKIEDARKIVESWGAE